MPEAEDVPSSKEPSHELMLSDGTKPETCSPPSKRSQYGLDWFMFFLSNVLNGVESFLNSHLIEKGWGPQHIGFAHSASSFATMLSQIPVGALVDSVRNKKILTAGAVLVVPLVALLFAFWPLFWPVIVGQVLLGVVIPLFCPAICAISLGLVGQACLGARFGRNQAFSAAGNVLSALIMGLLGHYHSTQWIFFFVAIVALPTFLALCCIRQSEINYERSRAAGHTETGMTVISFRELPGHLLRDRRLLVFFSCVILFQLGNACLFPTMVQMVARDNSPGSSSSFTSACVIVTQLVSALSAAWVGRRADRWGRKPLLIVGWAAVPVRGLLCTLTRNPVHLIGVEILDGVTAAVYAVVTVLVVADLAHGTGRFNLLLGALGVASGIGYTLSNALIGTIVQHYGFNYGFTALCSFGLASCLLLCIAMPETCVLLLEKK